MKKLRVMAMMALVGCAGATDEPIELDAPLAAGEVHGEAGKGEDGAVKVEREELARVGVPGGELVFYAARGPDGADEVAMLEVARPDERGRIRLTDREAPLAAYLDATDESAPVPRRLLATGDAEALRRAAGRAEVESLGAPLPVRAAVAGETPVALSSIGELCSGTTSSEFADEICTTYTYWDVNFCHNGTWHSVTDGVGSSQKMQWSRSRTLACGANGRVRHTYKVGGIWYEPVDEPIPSGTVQTWTYEGGTKLERKITHSRQGNSGFVRGSSHFRDFPF